MNLYKLGALALCIASGFVSVMSFAALAEYALAR
jgi:hypothetical protein